jgi:predicted DNA-binding protein YlxM (UPF0122 family)
LRGYARNDATADEVARTAGCGRGTVYNELKRIGKWVESISKELELDRDELTKYVVQALDE